MLRTDIKAKHPNHSLPPGLLRARQVKTVGTKASAAVFALGLTAAWFQGIKMPSPGQWSAAGLASFVCLGAIVLGVAVTKDKAQIEIHGGRLYIQWGAPSTGPPLAEGAIQVQQILQRSTMLLADHAHCSDMSTQHRNLL